jgi:hypothetical protein
MKRNFVLKKESRLLSLIYLVRKVKLTAKVDVFGIEDTFMKGF